MDLLHAMSSVSLSFYFPFYLQLLRKMTWWDFRCIFKDNPSRRPENSSSSSNCFSALYFPLIEHWKLEEYHMREVRLSHTVSSHGTTVARTHLHDWLIFILLIIIELILNIIHPFYRFVGKEMMTDLKYPMKPNTVPIWAVPIYAAVLPLMIFFLFYYRRRDVYDLHHAILGLFYALLVTAVITDSVKLAVGRPRPDFFWRCFPDGQEVYNALGDVVCHGDKASIKEGHKSFPSGHTSWSFAGLGFLSLYLGGKIKVFDRRGHVAKLCVVLLPILFACFVAISRVDDYWHHWTDVFTGGLLGFVVSLICYLQFFPPPHHHQGWGPYAYFRVLEELQESARAADSANSHNALVTEGQFENEHRAGTSNGFMGLHIDRDSNSQDLESGTGRR